MVRMTAVMKRRKRRLLRRTISRSSGIRFGFGIIFAEILSFTGSSRLSLGTDTLDKDMFLIEDFVKSIIVFVVDVELVVVEDVVEVVVVDVVEVVVEVVVDVVLLWGV